MKIEKNDLIKNGTSIAEITVGTAILAFGVAVFLVPYELVTGGVAGISIIISHVSPWEIVTPSLVLSVVSWLLFGVGALRFGKRFAAKTLLSAILYPPFVAIFTELLTHTRVGEYFDMSSGIYRPIGIIVAAVFGGIFVGVGVSLTLIGGGSTGGSDVIALIISERVKRLSASRAFLIVDTAIVLLGVIAIGDFVKSLLGVSSAFICSAVVDKLFVGGSRAITVEIITEKWRETVKIAVTDLGRSATVIDCEGGYTGAAKRIVRVTVPSREYRRLIVLVSALDHGAFVTVYPVREIKGVGW